MERISSTMVLNKHLDGADTIFSTIPGKLINNSMGKWFGVIRRGAYQASSEDSMWEYELLSYLW